MRLQTCALALALAGGLLGLVHIALTPLAYANWTIEALWFVGSGLAILLAAAANLIGFRAPGAGSRGILTAINLTMTGYFAAAWLVPPGPQVIVGGALFLCLACYSLAPQAWTAVPR